MNFLQLLAQYRTPAGEVIFQGFTYLGQELFVVLVICWLYWCSNKRLGYSLGFAYFFSGLLVQGLKITFRIPRPWILDPDFEPVASAVPGATGYSFPSGHTQSITSLFGTLALYLKKTVLRLLCFFVILAVMFSRMYLGCHTPKDVIVSFAVTFLCVLINHFFFYIKDCTENREGTTAAIMTAVSLLLAVYGILLNRYGVIGISYAQDCLKASGAGAAFAVGFYIERKYIRFSLPDTLKDKMIRLAAGLAVTLLFQEGLKPLLGASLPACFIRYFIVVAWVTILYPLLFSRQQRL